MEKIPDHLHYDLYDVPKKCNMAIFGAQKNPGFRPDKGYGYYEFVGKEYLKPHKNVVLMSKVCKTYAHLHNHDYDTTSQITG